MKILIDETRKIVEKIDQLSPNQTLEYNQQLTAMVEEMEQLERQRAKEIQKLNTDEKKHANDLPTDNQEVKKQNDLLIIQNEELKKQNDLLKQQIQALTEQNDGFKTQNELLLRLSDWQRKDFKELQETTDKLIVGYNNIIRMLVEGGILNPPMADSVDLSQESTNRTNPNI